MKIPISANPRGEQVLIINGCLLALTIVLFCMRFYGRHLMKAKLVLNDWAALGSMFFLICLYAIQVPLIYAGVGLHLMDIVQNWGGMETVKDAGRNLFIANVFWMFGMLLFKVSIIHLYIEVFGRAAPRFRLACWSVIGLCTVSTIAFLFQLFFRCKPLAFWWDISIPGGHCYSLINTYIVSGVVHTVLDLIIVILPTGMVWNLQMDLKKKLATIGVFSFGLGIVAVSGIRLKYVIELDPNDFTYRSWGFAIFGTVEPLLGLMSACVPMIPVVVTRHFKRRTWGQSGYASQSKSHGKDSYGDGTYQGRSRTPNGMDVLAEDEYPLQKPYPASLQKDNGKIRVTTEYTVESSRSSC